MNQSQYALLFDLDGTLLDTAPDFVKVLNLLLKEEGRAPLADAVIRTTVSSGARALVTLGFNLTESEDDFERLRQRLLALYDQHLAEQTRPFAGIDKLLQFCQNNDWRWGIVTNKPRRFTEPLMAQIALRSNADVIVCPDDVTHTKPHPEPMYLACKKLGIAPQNAIYVGDHQRDIEAGKNAGIRTVAAAYGYVEAHQSVSAWGADFIAQSAEDILPYLTSQLPSR